MTGDRIELTGLRATGYHGVFDFEKRDGQEFVVDLIVRADLRAAGASDDLADTIHYGELAEAVHARITGPAFDLIEALADAIAADTLRDPRIEAVEVTVHKPGAPIARTFADVSVTVCRARSIPIVIALGSNLGDRAATLASAIRELRDLPGVTVDAVSPAVETDPIGGPEQADYLNAVLVGRTALTAPQLLSELHRIEAHHGRIRTVRWGERTLDLDLIQYGEPAGPDELRSDDLALQVPHPRAAERAFVVLPWLAADPTARIRVGDSVIPLQEHAATLDSRGVRPSAEVIDGTR
ncbi:2-amino-4-hydroxy-6-hydroxymethyldihydropteridine diphosphokinase [Nostocoides jenkinsii]|uniref:Bifunctional folate synthesis protein n=1 Tax=Nostocoides jenkinsii Ben 74 TaxID=1193518 RepID=A0A077MFU9_9MICO|nr:2-amino-4-hydroxy-6-hydroxymethyldihydropteridine diphosphokinase [Tetrasphaera jenkinsii]CCI54153.1 Dihydroneopterin aldolase/2-amino-4-hydroxy-6-hydroxymethyldihydropteridine pyrophosphokinase [Tetrasphaera jenkinsii Ben 74]